MQGRILLPMTAFFLANVAAVQAKPIEITTGNLAQFISLEKGVCYLAGSQPKKNTYGKAVPELRAGARFKPISAAKLRRMFSALQSRMAALRRSHVSQNKSDNGALERKYRKLKADLRALRGSVKQCRTYTQTPPVDTPDPGQPSTCGNSIREGSERCDGGDLAGENCVTLGFASGHLACNLDCTQFDTASCVPIPGICENGILDVGEENIDCGGACPECQGNIEQYGITWTFDKGYRAGTYANGDYWVRGPLTVVSIVPDFDGLHHGWEANPSDFVKQGFDTRAYQFDSTLVPALPYLALPGTSIVKSLSNDVSLPAPKCPSNENHTCYLLTAAVLTVVDQVPADGGATLFRPPYFGAEKPLYSITELRTDLLPSVPPPESPPSLAWMEGRFKRVQLDHKRDWVGRSTHPHDNMPDYGGDIALNTGDGALRLMLDDPLEAKLPALVHYVQMGIDWYQILKLGGSWPPNGGHDSGRKLPIIMAAVLLDRQDMKDLVSSAPRSTFQEEGSLYTSAIANAGAGKVLFGQGMGDYWLNQVTDDASRTSPDPYGYIDGGHVPGESYQRGVNSMIWKGPVIAMQLMPEVAALWTNREEFIDYVDRWVTFGAWAQPDPCAPTMGRCGGGPAAGQTCTYANLEACPESFCGGGTCSSGPYQGAPCSDDGGPSPASDCGTNSSGQLYRCVIDPAFFRVTYGPDPADSSKCILDTDPSDGIGRHPYQHGRNADTGTYHSPFMNRMWKLYRLYHCVNRIQDQDEEGLDCGGSCVYDADQDGFPGRLCNQSAPEYDCNDARADINRNQPEICTKAREYDDNCDGQMHASYYLDGDLDGVNDCEDNCALDCNQDQSDLDFDGVGDACDDAFQLAEDFELMSDIGVQSSPGGLSFEAISGGASLGTSTHWGYQSKFLQMAGRPEDNIVITKQGRGLWSNYTLKVTAGQKYTTGGILLHYVDRYHYYLLNLRSGKLERIVRGNTTEIAGSGDSITLPASGSNADYVVQSEVGSSVRFTVIKDGVSQRVYEDVNPRAKQGSIGFFERGHAWGNYFIFDNIEILFENSYSGPHGVCS